MKTVKGYGDYINKADDSTVKFEFDYPIYEDINEVDPTEALKLVNRMAKTDARNRASASAQAKNGHNQRTLTEEEKAQRKAQREQERALLRAIKEKGLTAEDIASI